MSRHGSPQSEATRYAAKLVVIQTATERGVAVPGIRDLDEAEYLACRWLEHYARGGARPDAAQVDELAEVYVAKFRPEQAT